MVNSLRKLIKVGMTDYEKRPRDEWVTLHASQTVLTVSQTMWCTDITNCLNDPTDRLLAMRNFEQKSFQVCKVLGKMENGSIIFDAKIGIN